MAKMERIANESANVIRLITLVKLIAFSNRVEKYYPAATRREDLEEKS